MPPVLSMFSVPISPDRLLLTGIVTLASGFQLIFFARRVFRARKEYGIEYPAVEGNREFERMYRARQGTLELYPIFMGALWTSALFFHPVPSAICGMIYLVSRQRHFKNSSQAVEDRGLRCLGGMMMMAGLGMGLMLIRVVLRRATGGIKGGFGGSHFHRIPWAGRYGPTPAE